MFQKEKNRKGKAINKKRIINSDVPFGLGSAPGGLLETSSWHSWA
jgi:hypothetical protein